MHEIVINIVGVQPAQLFLEKTVQICQAFDQVVGKLGGDIDLAAELIGYKRITLQTCSVIRYIWAFLKVVYK